MAKKLNIRKTRRKYVVKENVYNMEIGVLCKKNTYLPCTKAVEGYNIQKSRKNYMGCGLFTEKNIGVGEFIVRYNGTWHNNILVVTGDYLERVRKESKDEMPLIKYIDITKSKSRAKYEIHVYYPNTILYKLMCNDK